MIKNMFAKIKNKALAIILLSAILSPIAGKAQGHCGTDEMFNLQAKNDTSLIRLRNEAFMRVRNAPLPSGASKSGSVRSIPVVFHVIHQYGPENISKQMILTEIDSLNKCYRAWNADTSLVRPKFKHLIADNNIQFVLAKKDPNGNCTDGIERIYSPLTTNAGDNVKSLSSWDQYRYFNIWVVASINSSSVPPGEYILGYSTLPYTYPNPLPSTDGVIIRADQIGTGTKTLVHEAGHYFGLYHPFQGGCSTPADCSTVKYGGDGMCDTPPTSSADFVCDELANACNNDTPMTENYMDYSSCSYLFTTDQATQIDYVLLNIRENLYSSSNLAFTGNDGSYNPTYCTPVSDFYTPAPSSCPGTPVQFFDASYNTAVTKYSWSFPGGVPSTSSDTNPVISYPSPGTYSVSLTATNPAGNSTKVKNNIISIPSAAGKITSPVFQGFEASDSSTSAWSFPQNTGIGGNLGFKTTTSAAFGGSNSLYLENRKGLAGNAYSFTLPPVDISHLSGITNYTIKFDYAFAKSISTDTDRFILQVSTDCGGNYFTILDHPGGAFTSTNRLVPLYNDFIPDSAEWKEGSASFYIYHGSKELYFKFSIFSGGGNDVYIDNINIGNYVTSGIDNKTTLANDVEVYPNPVTSQITIRIKASQNTNASFEAFDMAGRKMAEKDNIQIIPGSQEYTFSAGQFNISSEGMYYLKMYIANSVVVKKIIVAK